MSDFDTDDELNEELMPEGDGAEEGINDEEGIDEAEFDGSIDDDGAKNAVDGKGKAYAIDNGTLAKAVRSIDEIEEEGNRIIENSIENVMHNSMMPYSEYVILDRALPRVEDGLKPVQRRILYTMLELGVTPDKQHRKSARIVGDCLGKYHPHGDTSVYDAMVRMAQDFNMRMNLVDGHGNYGSVDGDSAAAMRYTEARLTPLAMEMLRDIEKNTVKWTFNFDDTLKEPSVLPSRFPNLLVNGSSGIAVGLATNIPPHNLTEVIDGAIAFIDNPRISALDMTKIIKGPDFPTGGQIIGGDELFNAYLKGRGKIKLRAKIVLEIDTSGKQCLVITELPYQTNKAVLLQKIHEQRELRKELFSDISDIVDESDRTGMRALIKLKKDAKPKKILEALYKHTGLETTFGINMVALAGGKPKQLGLVEMIRYYVDFQRNIIHKRTQFDLAAARERMHILEGLIIAISNIDEVIKLIKASRNQTEAKAKLRERFELSEKQAQAIVDMRLGRLTQLEITKLEAEIAELKIKIAEYERILSSTKNELDVVKKELADIRRIYKCPRKSTFISSSLIQLEVHDANVREEKEGLVILGADNTLRLVSSRSFAVSNIETTNFNSYELYKYGVSANNTAPVLAFTNLGNLAKINIDTLEEKKFKSEGVTLECLNKSVAEGEYPVAIFSENQLLDKRLIFYTKTGMIKCTSAAEYSVGKDYYQAVVLKDDEVLGVEIFEEDKTLLMVTKDGMVLNAEIEDVPLQGRKSAGVKGFQLEEGDFVVWAGLTDEEGELITISKNGMGKKTIVAEIEPSKRYRKGLKYVELASHDSVIFASIVKNPYHIVFQFEVEAIAVDTENIAILSRTSKPKNLLKNIGGEVKAVYVMHNEKNKF